MPKLERKKFMLGDTLGPFVGYTDGTKWNGWECPWFTAAEAKKLADSLNANEDDGTFANIVWDKMVAPPALWWFQFDASDSEVTSHCQAERKDTEDGEKLLLPIGRQAWTWEEVSDD